jgi:hypothetical protein
VAKIVIDGETFDYDAQKQPMSEALAIEEVYGARYGQWQQDLAAVSAKAYCALAWVIWRREGRDVPFADMLSGKVDFDLGEMLKSVFGEPGAEVAAEADPTEGSDPAGTPGTGTATSGSSRSGSGSGRGKSGS